MPRKKSGDFDQMKYINQFQKDNYKRVTVLVPLIDQDVLDHLNNQDSKSAYILNLIKEDMKKNQNNY